MLESAILTHARAVNNLRKIAKQTSKLNWEHGKKWYRTAHLLAQSLTSDTVSLSCVCGVIAALSPQCSWPENIRAATELLQNGKLGQNPKYAGYQANVDKATRILHGENPLQVLGGQKVLAFYDNMLNYRTSMLVTIDTHAARAAFNKLVLDPREISWVFRVNGNEVLQKAYQTVAKEYKTTPHVLQASLWLRVKDVINTDASLNQLGLYVK